MEFRNFYEALVILIGCIASFATCGNASANDAEFHANEAIQKVLKDFYNVKNEQERRQQFETLQELSDGHSDLVPQLVWFGSRASSTREGMVPGIVINALGISDHEVVTAMAPYLGVEDEKFRRNVEQLVRDLEPGLKSPQRSFEYLYSTLEESARRGVFPPRALIKFIYRNNPENALHNMQRAYLRNDPAAHGRPIVWAEHVIQDAIWKKEHSFEEAFQQAKPKAVEQLEKLVQQERWWARLYAAEILHRHPEFRTPEMMQRLHNDEHNLVRQAITETESDEIKGKGGNK